MLDFTPAAAWRPELFSGTTESTSTALAAVYGLRGEWTARSGAGLLAEFLDRRDRPWHSRVVDPVLQGSLDAVGSQILPAIAGHTVWPSEVGSGLVVGQPSFVGATEHLEAAAKVGPLAVMIEPGLAGALTLPDATETVVINLGSESVSLARGPDTHLDGAAAAVAGAPPGRLQDVADTACSRARLLAKHLVQIPGVRPAHGEPQTGRFVILTPRSSQRVIDEMQVLGVAGGVDVALPEYPGGFVVTCGANHTEHDLHAYAAAISEALD